MIIIKSLLVLMWVNVILTIWPPPYKIHLQHSEEFVISEPFDTEDTDDILSDEDEMINKVDIKPFKISQDSAKYMRIHRKAIREGYEDYRGIKRDKQIKWPEENYDKIEDRPWIAGYFKNNNSNAISENSNVYYLNQMARGIVDGKADSKREHVAEDVHYDYALFKQEYESDMKGAKKLNDTLDFVDVKEADNLKDVVKNMVNFTQIPRNCTQEEIKGIGVAAVECFWYDFKKVDTKEAKVTLFKRIMKLILIWLIVYILIAVPCWCQKGWCCCCFQCRFCKPRLRIDEVKKFMLNNPPGVYHKDGKAVSYKPTHYEKYAQKRLEQALLKL